MEQQSQSAAHAADEETTTTDNEVRRQDQDQINRFARLNVRKQELEQDLQQSKVCSECDELGYGSLVRRSLSYRSIFTHSSHDLQKELEHLDDASTELMMLSSHDKVLVMVGDAFMEESDDTATQVCEQLIDQVQQKVTKLQDELEQVLSEQVVLKKILYDRFGKSINLEDK